MASIKDEIITTRCEGVSIKFSPPSIFDILSFPMSFYKTILLILTLIDGFLFFKLIPNYFKIKSLR
jgi:hypothetical protein